MSDEHTPRYEIKPYEEVECSNCGTHGGHTTIHDDLYICTECNTAFDPRRTEYLESQAP